jgi:hypothetical protein
VWAVIVVTDDAGWIFISVEQRTPGNLDPDEWAILRG